mgnify:CR=1 FL=1|jgi:hypothetical protein
MSSAFGALGVSRSACTQWIFFATECEKMNGGNEKRRDAIDLQLKKREAWEEGLWGAYKPDCSPPVVTFVGHAFGTKKNEAVRDGILRAGALLIMITQRHMYDVPKLKWATQASLDTYGFVLPSYANTVGIVRRATNDSRALSPSYEMASILGNKRATQAWLQSQRVFEANLLEEYIYPWKVRRFPVFMKPSKGVSGNAISIVRSNATLLRKGFFLQEAVRNRTEWGAHFGALSATLIIVRCVSMQFKEDMFVRRHKKTLGTVQKITNRACPSEVTALASLLVARTRYHGIGCLGIKFRGATPKLIEVNARLCGMAVTHNSGAIMRDIVSSLLHGLNSKCCAGKISNCKENHT